MKLVKIMKRAELDKYISEIYNVSAEYPWAKYPTYAVYRHQSNKKWFAVIMELPKSKIGIMEDGTVDVMNLKCDPMLIGSLIQEEGIHKGYHMNKNYWITVRLDGSVDAEKIKWLLDFSFDLTNVKQRRSK